MLTFEEFFAKKRIDLTRLRQDQPSLYDEFSAHYQLMGEKSFDHTKKYWFNRLRKDFQLSEEAVAHLKKPATPNVSEAPASASESKSKPAGFTPRFKPKTTIVAKTEEPETDTPATSKPAGFKPRFKPKAVPAPSEEPTSKSPSEPLAETPKPLGFKPRFKAGVTPPAKPAAEEPAGQQPPSEEKPANEPASEIPKPLGFKPRFKAAPKPASDGEEEAGA